MSIVDSVADTLKKLETGNKIMWAIGVNLTQEQKDKISAIVQNGPEPFLNWINTESGRTALRAMADKLIEEAK